jgi:hypothetical protein
VLRTLEDEVPSQVGKTDEGLTTSRTRPELDCKWRSASRARELLGVQGRIPFTRIDTQSPFKQHTEPRLVPSAKLALIVSFQ